MRYLLTGLALLLHLAGCGTQGSSEPDGQADTPDPWADTDGDTIMDEEEGRADSVDSDGDTVPDYLDEDSDGDTIPDAEEGGGDRWTPPTDSDDDGTPDYRDWDSDDNGISDIDESDGDLDGDTIPDRADDDDDGDYIPDAMEIGSDPRNPVDWDGDGIPDHHDLDSDGDTIADRNEGHRDYDDDGLPNCRDLDSDGDTIPDAVEAGDEDISTPPRSTDDDCLFDFLDTDSDADGLYDGDEADQGLDPYDQDTDKDLWPDGLEKTTGTDPLDATDNPDTRQILVFVVNHEQEPWPDTGVLTFPSGTDPHDLGIALRDDESDDEDALIFIERVEADAGGSGLEVVDLDGDTIAETFSSVPADVTVRFDVIPGMNETVYHHWYSPLTYIAFADLVADGEAVLETRKIYFYIPAVWCYGGACE